MKTSAKICGASLPRLLVLALIAAVLQSFVPAGYMPSFAGGRLGFVECDGYVRIDMAATVADGSRHAPSPAAPDGQDSHRHHGKLQPCAFAVAGHFAVSSPAPAIAPATGTFSPPISIIASRLVATRPGAARARAPPIFL